MWNKLITLICKKLHRQSLLSLCYVAPLIMVLTACDNTAVANSTIQKSGNSEPNLVESPVSVVKMQASSVTLESAESSSTLAIKVESNALLPTHRIVAYYGNPLSKRMGILGEYDEDVMLERLQQEVHQWNRVDPSHPVIPALHLIAVVAQGSPGSAGKYRMIMPDDIVNKVYKLAQDNHALLIIDIQTGHDDIRNILPRFAWILKQPDVHLGIDPEFNLISSGAIPGSRIGTYDAKDINYVSAYLDKLVKENNLPPKVLIVHRFTQKGVTNAKKIVLHPDVQIVMNMDGWGPPILKRGTYRNFIVPESVQYTGFKLFYHNDTKAGDKLMSANDVLKLNPQPLYIQYQ